MPAALPEAKQVALDSLLAMIHHHDAVTQQLVTELAQNLAPQSDAHLLNYNVCKDLFKHGENMLAYDLLRLCQKHSIAELNNGEATIPEVVNSSLEQSTIRQYCLLKQLEGQVLHASMSFEPALQIYQALAEQGSDNDVETVGNMASLLKSMALNCVTPEQRQQHLQQSIEIYQRVYQSQPDSYWMGINVATLAVLDNRLELAVASAEAVAASCEPLTIAADDFWPIATMAEVALIRYITKPSKTSRTALQQGYEYANQIAHKLAVGIQGKKSLHKNAKILIEASYNNASINQDDYKFLSQGLELWLPMPTVVCFSGHRVDAENRSSVRFPATSEELIKSAIEKYLEDTNVGFVFSSLSNGSDIILCESARKRQISSNMIIPFAVDQFKQHSVAGPNKPGTETWEARFDSIMRQRGNLLWQAGTQAIEEKYSDTYYAYANQVLYGLAAIKAREVGAKLNALVVWDGINTNGICGTDSAVADWHARDLDITVVDPLSGDILTDNQLAHMTPTIPAEDPAMGIKSLIFADVAGYSKFTELQVAAFVTVFLQKVADLLDRYERPPLEKNGWGDGIYMVFADLKDAGDFALSLCEEVLKHNESGYWAEHGLPAKMQIRVSIHSAPVLSVYDPLKEQHCYAGSHVSHAARIEPITPPNEVYASLGAAALAECDNSISFNCHYVGKVQLAKNYGSYDLFKVRRKKQ